MQIRFFYYFYNSDSQCPTLISVKGQTVKKIANQPIRLLPNDLIHFLCPKSSKGNSKVFGIHLFTFIYLFILINYYYLLLGFTIMLSPNMVAKVDIYTFLFLLPTIELFINLLYVTRVLKKNIN